MDTQHIKIGETYLLPVTVTAIEKDGWIDIVSYSKYVYRLAPSEVKTLLQNGTKNTETAPKYDPCRKFRKGDIVTPKERNGRIPWGKDMKLTVVDDERMAGVSVRDEESGESHFICVLFLKLVTPVEELEPYRVETGGYNRFRIKKGNLEYSYFPFGEHCVLSMDEAKAAAEAERDRLNAEWRKEKNNENA